MGQEGLKIFISYSHLDEKYIDEFNKHLAPLKNNGFIESWHDRKINAGQNFENTIDNNLENADIVCLFISANFLNSIACIKEKEKALELKIERNIPVIPIILSSCGWLDDNDLSLLLALPVDGKPISKFTNQDDAFNNVYNGIKSVVEKEIQLRLIKIKESFLDFLNDSELLSKAHSHKDKVLLNEIFIYPYLEKFDDIGEFENKLNSKIVFEDIVAYSKILIAGDDQSGKTSLCKKAFLDFFNRKIIPVYIKCKSSEYNENFNSRLSKAFNEQYENIELQEIDKSRIIPILDDFHFLNNKEKIIEELSIYPNQIIIVDDIFRMNFKNENIVNSFNHFKIKELSPILRNELIKKWIEIDKKNAIKDNGYYKNLDQKTELVETSIGKILGMGIMPSYPFFLLTVLSTYDTLNIPIEQEITSQGYCYQALIYIYLTKQGVKNDEIDTYMNFLIEFAYYLFANKKNELSIVEFEKFMEQYLENYNLHIDKDTILLNLQNCKIINLDSCNNYSFLYSYLYYFFVAKYLADHCDTEKIKIDEIINNLQKNENAYISIFISHHTKNNYILDEIMLNAFTLFDDFIPTSLTKNELKFFDDEIDIIIKEALPYLGNSPEQEREKRLKIQEEREDQTEKNDDSNNTDDTSKLAQELRRGIRTVEVMGQIIKNRAGSLEKDRIKTIFEEAMKVYLRILSQFFDLIKNNENQEIVVEYISNKLSKIISESDRDSNKDENTKLAKKIFWNLNFSVLYFFIDRIIRSLGSDKLINVVEEVCDSIDTPSSFLVKQGIFMWYNKNLQIDNISNKFENKNYSEVSKKIMRFIIVNYASMHQINYKEKQKIESKLGIPSRRLLVQNFKKKNEK
ncbi:MAG: toll/interleukin-1 receptor domain-containing protein [Bacteroidetes bacterium]|nr:toll/interleukin-1 receptor domain-containing protein [Bacteroidota bacterium]